MRIKPLTTLCAALLTAAALAGCSTATSAPSPSVAWNSPAHARAFFATIEPAAVSAMHSTGIPASVLMAVAAKESALGTTDFATQAHNLFAQACGKSKHCVGNYRWYKDWAHSLQSFASHMAHSPVVQTIMQMFPGDTHKIADAIANITSVDPKYAQEVTDLIARYKLRESDLSIQ